MRSADDPASLRVRREQDSGRRRRRAPEQGRRRAGHRGRHRAGADHEARGAAPRGARQHRADPRARRHRPCTVGWAGHRRRRHALGGVALDARARAQPAARRRVRTGGEPNRAQHGNAGRQPLLRRVGIGPVAGAPGPPRHRPRRRSRRIRRVLRCPSPAAAPDRSSRRGSAGPSPARRRRRTRHCRARPERARSPTHRCPWRRTAPRRARSRR